MSSLKKLFSLETLIQALKYGAVGILNTLLTMGILFLGANVLMTPFLATNITGYILGLTLSFFLNKKFTFDSSGKTGQRILKFLAVFAVCYGLQLLISYGVRALGVGDFLAQLAGMAFYTPASFVLNKIFTFKENKNEDLADHTLL